MIKIDKMASPAGNMDARYDWDRLIQEDRVNRQIYTDPNIFTEEMSKIFGAVWVYIAHESQIPDHDDFITARLGLRPIIVTRDSGGRIRALFNRCTHRGATICRQDHGSAKGFQCPYHGWAYSNNGKLSGVPWPDGYAEGAMEGERFNLAQVARVESYRGFIFATLNGDAPSLDDYLGPVKGPIDEWLDRHPGGKVAICNANRLKFNGNWKLAYDNAADGYHVVFSHRSLLAMENRLVTTEDKGMSYYKENPDAAPMYVRYFGNGHHFKDKRPNMEVRPGAMWEIESLHPGMENVEEDLRRRHGDKANALLDLASSEPVNINVFPNLILLGNHIQVIQPISVTETDTTWWGTAVIDVDGDLGDDLEAINALRMRTQEGFPNFGEVDDLMNFEQIQSGLAAVEDEWVYMHRGLGIEGRITVDDGGVITGPATDELFMRETMKVYKRLMTSEPDLAITRNPDEGRGS
jgi:phenylpropionate dioxygenase-like ring-hydroxylating dioxygenase large terminal subunit